MRSRSDTLVRLESGEPWRLTLEVVRAGRDLVCHLHGGDVHVGAVALAEPEESRARVRSVEAVGHREREVSEYAARRLAEASGRRVACVAGIHFEGIDRQAIEGIVAVAHALTEEAAGRIEGADPGSREGGER